MKKYVIIFITSLVICALIACSDNSNSIGNINYNNITLKSGNIVGAKALAVASKSSKTTRTAITRGDGNKDNSSHNNSTATATDALYKLSDDGKFIEITYTFDVTFEDEDDPEAEKFTEKVQANLRISPNFIYNVGDDFLWLANCFYAIPNYDQMPEDAVKKALTSIRDEFNNAHHDSHGAHYLIRKSNGAMYEWSTANAAPYAMADGYNPPSMLGRWFHAIGKKMYVRDNFFYPNPYYGNPFCTGRVVCISDNGSSLNYTEVIPASQKVTSILPAGKNLGVICADENNYPVPYIFFTASNTLVPLETSNLSRSSGVGTCWSLLSVGGELYAMSNYKRGDANEGGNMLRFYKINYGNGQASVGEQVAELEASIDWNDDKFFGTGASTTANTFTFFAQDYRNNWRATINTFSPDTKEVRTRYLPDHYNDNSNFYIEGIACNEVTDKGFYVCDLSKDQAEYVALDWSNASNWQSKVESMEYVHFEAAFMAVKYEITTTDKQQITAWVPITGESAGKVSIFTDDNGDPNLIINVLLSL